MSDLVIINFAKEVTLSPSLVCLSARRVWWNLIKRCDVCQQQTITFWSWSGIQELKKTFCPNPSPSPTTNRNPKYACTNTNFVCTKKSQRRRWNEFEDIFREWMKYLSPCSSIYTCTRDYRYSLTAHHPAKSYSGEYKRNKTIASLSLYSSYTNNRLPFHRRQAVYNSLAVVCTQFKYHALLLICYAWNTRRYFVCPNGALPSALN